MSVVALDIGGTNVRAALVDADRLGARAPHRADRARRRADAARARVGAGRWCRGVRDRDRRYGAGRCPDRPSSTTRTRCPAGKASTCGRCSPPSACRSSSTTTPTRPRWASGGSGERADRLAMVTLGTGIGVGFVDRRRGPARPGRRAWRGRAPGVGPRRPGVLLRRARLLGAARGRPGAAAAGRRGRPSGGHGCRADGAGPRRRPRARWRPSRRSAAGSASAS